MDSSRVKANALIESLKKIVGVKGVLLNSADIAPFLEDWRGKKKGGAICVVRPVTTKQISQIILLANEENTPVFLQGGNTSLCYGSIPSIDGNGILMLLSGMSTIRSVDAAASSVTVDAGVILSHVHNAAAEVERQFPLYLGSEGSAQIGGLIATNAGGTGAIRYGTMRDLVYGLEVVLPDGSIISDLAPLRKNNIGYDLKHLFIGSEGTLGVVTGASLKLFPSIKSNAHAWIALNDVDNAIALLMALQSKFDASVLACELLSRTQIDITLNNVPLTRLPFDKTPEWSIIVHLGSSDPSLDITSQIESFLADNFDELSISDAVVAQNSSQSNDFWHVRHSVSEANKKNGIGLTHDVVVKISSIPAFLQDASSFVRTQFPDAEPLVVCHLGDGNIHYIVMFSHECWNNIADHESVIAQIEKAVHDLALKYDGSFSAEHGIGRKLIGEHERLVQPARLHMMRAIKQAFDKNNILNPGILLK